MSAPLAPPRATLDDLLRTDGKAELIGGRIVHFMASGDQPSTVAFRVARRLADYADDTGRGVAYADGIGFTVPELLSGRESFSPDASYYTGARPVNRMRFVENPPDFAVEVRSENDYGPAAERDMAAKRGDYFEAGTLVVWDVDPEAGTVTKHAAGAAPVVFAAGAEADAEPAVPGWRVSVDWLMR